MEKTESVSVTGYVTTNHNPYIHDNNHGFTRGVFFALSIEPEVVILAGNWTLTLSGLERTGQPIVTHTSLTGGQQVYCVLGITAKTGLAFECFTDQFSFHSRKLTLKEIHKHQQN